MKTRQTGRKADSSTKLTRSEVIVRVVYGVNAIGDFSAAVSGKKVRRIHRKRILKRPPGHLALRVDELVGNIGAKAKVSLREIQRLERQRGLLLHSEKDGRYTYRETGYNP